MNSCPRELIFVSCISCHSLQRLNDIGAVATIRTRELHYHCATLERGARRIGILCTIGNCVVDYLNRDRLIFGVLGDVVSSVERIGTRRFALEVGLLVALTVDRNISLGQRSFYIVYVDLVVALDNLTIELNGEGRTTRIDRNNGVVDGHRQTRRVARLLRSLSRYGNLVRLNGLARCPLVSEVELIRTCGLGREGQCAQRSLCAIDVSLYVRHSLIAILYGKDSLRLTIGSDLRGRYACGQLLGRRIGCRSRLLTRETHYSHRCDHRY